jgi:hypothetical protein
MEKKFQAPDIVILVLLAVFNDLLAIIAVIGVAIPVIGIVIGGAFEIVNTCIWGIIMMWFIMKTGSFGAIGLIQTAGGIAQYAGIPGRTVTTVIGIVMANHPKAAKIAAVAGGTAISGGAAAGAAAKSAGSPAAKETTAGLPPETAAIQSPPKIEEPREEAPEAKEGIELEPYKELRLSMESLPTMEELDSSVEMDGNEIKIRK